MKSLTPAFANGCAAPGLRSSAGGAWVAQAAVAGFVAGHSFLPNHWLHLGWLLIAGTWALAWADWSSWRIRFQPDAGVVSIVCFLAWMLIRSCVQIPFMAEHATDEVISGILGMLLLVIFCLLLWQQAHSGDFLRNMGWTSGLTSALAALISIVLSYGVLPNHQAGERLSNLLVHGGLNPVCTGLIFGFSALWLAALMEDGVVANRMIPFSFAASFPSESPGLRRGGLGTARPTSRSMFAGSAQGRAACPQAAVGRLLALLSDIRVGIFHALPSRWLGWAVVGLLHFAALLSGSRGAMLALACGHAVLLLARGWRRGSAAACVFVLTAVLYFTSAPLFARIQHWRAESAAATAAPQGVKNQLQKAVERGDNCRLDIYRAGWHAVDHVWLGTGQWGVRGLWQCELQAKTSIMMMSHLHSAFFATLVHGGIIGAALLLVVLGRGIRCALRLARAGDATWISLLAFGCGGLLFDGESLASLATAPRYEGLLFWLPLIVALARGSATAPHADS